MYQRMGAIALIALLFMGTFHRGSGRKDGAPKFADHSGIPEPRVPKRKPSFV